MDVLTTILEDAISAVKVISYSTTAASFLTVLFHSMENAIPAILTMSSDQMDSVLVKTSIVINWTITQENVLDV
jgi:hypothetical protein